MNRAIVFFCGAVLGIAGWARASAYSDLVAFGDSLSDAGNGYAMNGQPASPPYFEGRASDGPVWVERLGPMLGLAAPTPSALGGANATDYAYYGAATTGGTVPSVQQQVQTYLSTHAPSSTDLFTIQGGTNDFSSGVLDPTAPANAIRDDISTLIAAGAKHVLVMNLPPLGKTPEFVGGPLESFVTGLSNSYDATLNADLTSLRAAHSDVSISLLDANALFQQIMADPGTYGLTDVTHPALSGTPPTAGPDADQHLFWDSGHPTATGHQLLAEAAVAALPEPSVAMVTLVGLLEIIGVRRRTIRVATRL